MSNLQRIKIVLDFYCKRGTNKERINKLYYKILNESLRNETNSQI